jgi:uncharacterized membrane protein
MNNTSLGQGRESLIEKYELLSKQERDLINRIVERKHTVRNINKEFDNQLTFGQRVADKVAAFGGSWTFIIIFASILVTWIILNAVILARIKASFDPYPFILLNLFLSMLAAIQAPIIMMSQNRQAAKDRLDATHDYEINIKAETEIAKLHEKIDELREKQWAELVQMQQEQIQLLTQLLNENKK